MDTTFTPAFSKINALLSEMNRVIIGKTEVVKLTVTALLADGHVLFEDVPGVGKTLLVKTLSKTIQGKASRVQFTPDLLPSDILGISIYDTKSQEFRFRPGPIFTTILLADEINRTTPRTQAALLEAMSENHVTIDNHTYPLDEHFFVLATQNPIEFEGTYPLPEAQLDRFLFRLQIGYPTFEDEMHMLLQSDEERLKSIQQVLTSKELSELKALAAQVTVDPAIVRYALQLIDATRHHPLITLGISPRTSHSFLRAAKAYALVEGRSYVTPSDIQQLIAPTFRHRLILANHFSKEQDELDSLLVHLIEDIPVPVRSGL